MGGRLIITLDQFSSEELTEQYPKCVHYTPCARSKRELLPLQRSVLRDAQPAQNTVNIQYKVLRWREPALLYITMGEISDSSYKVTAGHAAGYYRVAKATETTNPCVASYPTADSTASSLGWMHSHRSQQEHHGAKRKPRQVSDSAPPPPSAREPHWNT